MCRAVLGEVRWRRRPLDVDVVVVVVVAVDVVVVAVVSVVVVVVAVDVVVVVVCCRRSRRRCSSSSLACSCEAGVRPLQSQPVQAGVPLPLLLAADCDNTSSVTPAIARPPPLVHSPIRSHHVQPSHAVH